MFTTVCPGCEASLNAPDSLKGKKVKCKKCGEPFVADPARTGQDRPLPKTVKSPGVAPPPKPRKSEDEEPTEETNKLSAKKRRSGDDEDDTEIMEAHVVDDDEEDLPQPRSKKKAGGKRRKEKKSSAMLIVLIAVGALLVLGGGAVGAYYAFIKEETKPETPQAKGGTTTANTGGGAASAAGWVDFHEPEGRYRVKFPQTPGTPIAQRQPVGNGENMDIKLIPLNLGSEAFVSGHAVVPAALAGVPADQFLDLATNDQSAQAKGATIRSRKQITYQGFPGREVVIDFPGKKTPTVMRVIMANDRMIMLVAASENAAADQPRVKTFFESLKIE